MISWIHLWLGEDSPAGTRRWLWIHVWKMTLFLVFQYCFVYRTLCVCFPGWNSAGCHQWLISLRRFHLQTTSQTLQGSTLLHPPTGAIYGGSIAPRWWIEHMHTQTGSLHHFCLCQTSFQTELGQALDLMTAPPGQIDLNRFTMDR